MPNWCYNQISISHDDKAPFDWLVNILQHGHSGIFNAIVPLPGGEWDCDLAVSQWGTKWDILPEESPAAKRCPEAEICDLQFASDECGNWVHFTCETAWGHRMVFLNHFTSAVSASRATMKNRIWISRASGATAMTQGGALRTACPRRPPMTLRPKL